jgi:hypothetical protein
MGLAKFRSRSIPGGRLLAGLVLVAFSWPFAARTLYDTVTFLANQR